jgi:DNA polymerase-3 subunit gamma/tau
LFEVGDAVKEKYVRMAQQCPATFLYKAIDLTNDCDLNYRASRNKRLLMELLLIRLCQLNRPSDTEDDKKKTLIEPIVKGNTVTNTETVNKGDSQPVGKENAEPLSKGSTVINAKPVSITIKKQLKADPKESEEIVSQEETVKLNESFSEEDLLLAWKTYANREDDIHLKNTMLNFAPVLKEGHRIEIGVANPAQQTKLNEKISDLYDFLSAQLKNTSIRIEIKINEEENNSIPFTDKEKYQHMASKNASLDVLVKEFNLHLD